MRSPRSPSPPAGAPLRFRFPYPSMKTAPLVAAVIGLFCVLRSTSFAQAKVEEVVLGPASGQSYSSSVPNLSKRGLHVATQVAKGSRFAMRVDGVDGPAFDRVEQGFVFSTDGARNAYSARVDADIIVVVEVSTLWIPSDLKYAGALVVLILILLVRPQGLLGRKERLG